MRRSFLDWQYGWTTSFNFTNLPKVNKELHAAPQEHSCCSGIRWLEPIEVRTGTSFLTMWGLYFSSKLDWVSYFVCIAQTVCNKTVAFIHSGKTPSLGMVLWLCKSTILLCMKYCCHTWPCAPNFLLDMLDNVGLAVAASLPLLNHHHSKTS